MLDTAVGRLDRGTEFAPSVTQQPTDAARASGRGLDWFTFFVADIQTGFGPFVVIYLTAQSWSQLDIGLALTVGGLAALACQLPGGVLVDAVRSTRTVAALAVVGICLSAAILAVWPIFVLVLFARVLHALASCVLGPAIATISLKLAGHGGLGERLGRNARFASIGNGIAAAAMGACGYLVSDQAVFFLTAALAAPAILALGRIAARDLERSRFDEQKPLDAPAPLAWRDVVADRRLIVFAICIMLFQLANAAMLPLMGGILAKQSGEWASTIIGACIVVPQLIVAAFSPWVGRAANRFGRRPLLFACFAALAVRGLLFAFVTDPYVVVAVQVFDGVSAAVLAVMVPLVVADLTRGSGRFNFAFGIVGSAVGIGAALSTTLGGYLFDHFGASVAFASLASVGVVGALVLLFLAETRPTSA